MELRTVIFPPHPGASPPAEGAPCLLVLRSPHTNLPAYALSTYSGVGVWTMDTGELVFHHEPRFIGWCELPDPTHIQP